MKKQIKLTAKFINKTYFGRKLVKNSVETYGFEYFGASKKECKEKARKALKYGANWDYTFEPLNIQEDEQD